MDISNLTVQGYIDLISSLQIRDFVLFYFIAYFLVSLIQRSLGVEFDTAGNIRTNPKILIGLLIVHFFQTTNSFIAHYILLDNKLLQFMLVGLVFVLICLLFEKTLLSKNGVMKLFYKYFLMKIAAHDIAHEADKNNRKAEIDKVKLTETAINHTKAFRGEFVLFLIDFLVSILVTAAILRENTIMGLIVLTVSIWFIHPRANALISRGKGFENKMHGKFTKIIQPAE